MGCGWIVVLKLMGVGHAFAQLAGYAFKPILAITTLFVLCPREILDENTTGQALKLSLIYNLSKTFILVWYDVFKSFFYNKYLIFYGVGVDKLKKKKSQSK